MRYTLLFALFCLCLLPPSAGGGHPVRFLVAASPCAHDAGGQAGSAPGQAIGDPLCRHAGCLGSVALSPAPDPAPCFALYRTSPIALRERVAALTGRALRPLPHPPKAVA